MNFAFCLADFEVRDYLALREVVSFCYRHNCDYIENASSIRIVSKLLGNVWADVPNKLVADMRFDTPHVLLLRALVDNLESLHEHDSIVNDSLVRELLSKSAS